MRRIACVLAVLAGATTSALAQPGAGAPAPLPPPTEPSPEEPGFAEPTPLPAQPAPAPQKSVKVGLGLTIAGSLLPLAGIGLASVLDDDGASKPEKWLWIGSVVGALALPSVGLVYAGDYQKPHMGYGAAARLFALGAMVLGVVADDLGEPDSESRRLYWIAGGLYALGCGIDLFMTSYKVRQHNERHRPRTIVVAPTVVPGGGGLAVGGFF